MAGWGTGEAKAPRQYLLKKKFTGYARGEEYSLPPLNQRAQVTGISMKMPNEKRLLEDFTWVTTLDEVREIEATGKFAYLEVSLNQFAKQHPAQFNLVTDFRAATTYSLFDRAIADIWTVLKLEGEAYFSAESIVIEDLDGSYLPVTQYLDRGRGLNAEVVNWAEDHFKLAKQTSVADHRYGDKRHAHIKVVKTGSILRLPELEVVEAWDSTDLGVITHYRLTNRMIEIKMP